MRPSILLATALLLAVGCAPRLEPVGVDFQNLRLDGFERGELDLLIANPNRVAVDIEAMRYSLALGRDTVALGERQAPLRVPAGDTVTATFGFEFRFELDGIFNRLGALLDDTLQFELDGRYSVPGLFGPRRRPFRYRHELPLRAEVEKLLGPLRSLFGGEGR